MSRVQDTTLLSFLSDSVSLWGAGATVEAASAPAIALVRAHDGAVAWIERARESTPFRWAVRWRAANETAAAHELRPRLCASLVGLLNTLQRALGVARGSPVRVAPRPLVSAPVDQTGNSNGGAKPRTAERPHDERIPVTVLTGFLGSGKTTLLARLLRDPQMARTAVIINEFGEIPLDHDLIETGDESFVTLSNGCLCCRVRSDFVLTLGDLAARRAAGTLPCFERVVIETSGLADPAPILHTLMVGDPVREIYALDAVITTVDAVTGSETLARYPESLRQAAIADHIVLTKTDVAAAATGAVMSRLREVNPRAAVTPAVRGEIRAAELFGSRSRASKEAGSGFRARPGADLLTGYTHAHTSGLTTFAVVRDEPLHAATLALFLSLLAENCGSDLLRMKGIVRVAEDPGRPAVIHGVQHVYHAPEWLERWPSRDRRTRLVFIGRNLSERWVRDALDLLDSEVRETLRTRSAAAL